MVDWKIYIDSPQERALHPCGGSLTEGDGNGGATDRGARAGGYGGYGEGYGYGWGCGYGYGLTGGSGRSADKW